VKSVAAGQAPEGGLEILMVSHGYGEQQLRLVEAVGCKVLGPGIPLSTSDSRNLGAAAAVGKYLLFLDDDNVIAPDTIRLLYLALRRWSDAAVVGPVMYYGSKPGRIWCAGVTRSRILMKTTMRTRLPVKHEERLPSDDLPNSFMVRRAEFVAIGGFDAQRFPQHYEEGDLARRLRTLTGGKAFIVSSARTWHFIGLDLAERLHLRNPERAYLCARGRAVFTAMYGDSLQWLAYLALGQWLFAALHLSSALMLLPARRFEVMLAYLRGALDGLRIGARLRRRTTQPHERSAVG
jgi:GT2 family glycosyltransferase